MITDFDDFRMPDLNLVSKEFWKMTTVSNWKKVIVDYGKLQKEYDRFYSNANELDKKCKEVKEKSAARIYKKYSYQEVRKFRFEYDKIYGELYNYFKGIWLSDENEYGPSDDGYSDLLSSMIGSGKRFTNSCINEPMKFIDMAKNRSYVENFGYKLNPDKEEYDEIRSKYDPLFRDTKKFNI